MFDKYEELLSTVQDPRPRELLLELIEEHSIALTALHYLSNNFSVSGAFCPSSDPKRPTIERHMGGILVVPEI